MNFLRQLRIVAPVLIVLVSLWGDGKKNPDMDTFREGHIAYIQSFYEGIEDIPGGGFEAEFTYPYQAAFQEYIMTMDPSNRKIPAHRRIEAARKAISLNHQRSLMVETGLKSAEEPILWNELPANTGGRTRALMFDPTDPEHKKVWAGAVTGGLWYTDDITDPSENWKPVDDFWETLAIGCICSDPNDPETFYVGTGEGQTAFVTYRESSGTGRGIMRSTDAGDTWELMPSTKGFAYITDIQVRNEEGKSVIYVGTKSGEYKGEFFMSEPDNGLYRSADAGETWQQVLPVMPGKTHSYSVSDIEVTTAGRLFVGTTNDLDLEGGGRIFSSDDGVNWTLIDTLIPEILADRTFHIPGRVILTSAPSDPQRIYALVGSGAVATNGILYIYCRKIIRSEDGGATWIKGTFPDFRNDPGHPANWAYIAWHALTAAVDPQDPDLLYVGGCDIHRSGDGGMTWDWISDTWMVSLHEPNNCRYVHADQHALIFQPGSRDLLINANDGGVFMTLNASDREPCWTERNEAFNTMQYYTCDMHSSEDTLHYLGGTQDNSTMLYEGKAMTDDGSRYLGGDGAYCFIDQNEPDVHILSTQWNNYAFTDKLKDTLMEFSNMFKSGLFINPVDYDSRSNTLIGNAALQEGIYLDNIIIITGIPNYPYGRLMPVYADARVPFSAVLISPHSPSQVPALYLGTQSGRLFKVQDVYFDQPRSEEIGSPDFPAANISCIQVGNSEAELLISFSNYGVSSVWVSKDGGKTWLDRDGNLPDMPVRWVLWHPVNKNHVLLATEVGVWSTQDIWTEDVVWEPELEGLANVRIDMMKVREADNVVLAASHGRGLYTGKWEVAPENLKPAPEEESYINLFPNPTDGIITIEYKPRWTETIGVEVFDQSGRKVLEKRFLSYAGQYQQELDLSGLGAGTYICRISMGSQVTSHQVFISRTD